ncbi:MAG TPA: A24 family peptidase [Polyangiaceae bacterium]|jgi:prepilin peptidase CpaA|nr:A24 family peptidase [Polyangiaceae bacterium]
MLPFLIGAVCISAIAAYTDLRRGLIPNALTLGGALAGALGHLAHGWQLGGWSSGLSALGASLAGGLLCALAPLVLFAKGGMGGGDVKLFAALGVCCHPLLGIEAQLYAFVLAASFVPAQLLRQGRLRELLGRARHALLSPLLPRARRRPLPPVAAHWLRLGPAIFGGTLLALLSRL